MRLHIGKCTLYVSKFRIVDHDWRIPMTRLISIENAIFTGFIVERHGSIYLGSVPRFEEMINPGSGNTGHLTMVVLFIC